MIIHKLQIEGFGDVSRIVSSFDPRLAVLSGENAGTVSRALGAILKSKAYQGKGPPGIREDTVITAEAEEAGESFRITACGSPGAKGLFYEVASETGRPRFDFYDRIRLNREEESLTAFVYRRTRRFSDRFRKYKDVERFYPDGSFRQLTDGTGNTRTFRACLNGYIRRFQPQILPAGRDIWVDIDEAGRFVTEGGGKQNTTDGLNEYEDRLFELMCFLNVNRFWKEFEEIRDLNHIDRPLFITGLAGGSREVKDIRGCISETLTADRQIFLCGSG